MRRTLTILALLCFVLAMASCATAAAIFSDDFATDPFASRWSQSTTWGTAGYNYDASGQTVKLWASGMGGAQAKSLGTAPTITKGYTAAIDFRSDLGIGGNVVVLWANRQSDDSHYQIIAYPGGSGEILFQCSGGGINLSQWTGQLLTTGVWYTLKVIVSYTAGATNITSKIIDRSTGALVVGPWTVSDSTPQRLTGNTGYGFAAASEQPQYLEFISIDNYSITEEPTVENDDFSNDPFASRWTQSTTSGTAGLSHDSANETVQFWASGMGNAMMKSQGTSATITRGYVESIDFRNDSPAVGQNWISLWANRQSNDAHYYVQAYHGGSGEILWGCGGGGVSTSQWSGIVLSSGVWYTLQVGVSYTTGATNISAQIINKSTGALVIGPWTVVDSSSSRLTGNTGYGMEAGTGQPQYTNFMSFDNFKITQDPPVENDDFATEPFVGRWSRSTSWNTGWFGYDIQNQSIEFWASGMGGAQAKSNGTSPTVTDGYQSSIDFRSDYGIATNSVSLWLNRQLDDSHYTLQSYPGGSGEVALSCTGGGLVGQNIWTGQFLVPDVWYTLAVKVQYTLNSTRITASINNRSTGLVVVGPWTVVDSSLQRLTSNTGYGFAASTDQSQYVRFMTLDNYRFALLPPPISTLGAAKSAEDGALIDISNAIVTTTFIDDNSWIMSFAVEDASRASGIRVISATAVYPGDKVRIQGVASTTTWGDRVIEASQVDVGTSYNTVPEPVALNNISTAGGALGAQRAVVNDASASPMTMSTGLNNIGLYVKIYGKVVRSNDTGNYSGYFYIDDGSGLIDLVGGYKGICCRPPTNYDTWMPQEGRSVWVLGVMGTQPMNDWLARYFWTDSWGYTD